MLIDVLDKQTKEALADRLEGWELVDFLDIPIEEIIDLFEDNIMANLEEVKDFANIIDLDNDNNDD